MNVSIARWSDVPDIHRCWSEDERRIAYYREVFLTQRLLPVMREICEEFFICQQGSVPAH